MFFVPKSFRPAVKEWFFFIPRALKDGAYTHAQLAEIDKMLAALGADLYPLDPNLVN
jgi:hypothetical protein